MHNRWNKQWCCLNCGGLIFHEIPFCQHCFNLLETQFLKSSPREIGGVDIHSLFNWNPQESDSLSFLVLYLKLQPPVTWQVWANLFKTTVEFSLSLSVDTVLLPCPGRGSRKHANYWASSLGQEYGLPVEDVFEYISSDRGTTHEQKTLKARKEVSRIRLKDPDNLYWMKNKRLIFVDDVITSGTTLMQASKAIYPLQFDRAFSLANRGKLAGILDS